MPPQAQPLLEYSQPAPATTLRLLLAVSEHVERQFAVRFAAQFLAGSPSVNFTILYLLPRLYAEQTPTTENATLPGTPNLDFLVRRESEDTGKEGIEAAKRLLEACDFDLRTLNTIARPRTLSKASEIIDEGTHGKFDAIVLGKRGRTWFDSILEGGENVGRSVLKKWCRRPVWLCPEVPAYRKNILLCIDDSEESLQLTRHVGHVLGAALHQSVTLLIVEPAIGLTDDTPAEVALMQRHKSILKEQGIGEDRILAKYTVRPNPATAILDQIEKYQYAAVAIARGYPSTATGSRRLFGPVTETLYRRVSSAALWIQS